MVKANSLLNKIQISINECGISNPVPECLPEVNDTQANIVPTFINNDSKSTMKSELPMLNQHTSSLESSVLSK